MIYAFDSNGVQMQAERGARGTCPVCGKKVVARCGEQRIWHWAHERRLECDDWYECETAWHRGWKSGVTPERVEVPFGPHRADIVATDGAVVELQHSDISMEAVREREAFYGKMLWLIDGEPFRGHFRVELGSRGAKFHWSPPRPTWLGCKAPRFVHGFTVGRFVRQVNRFSGKVEPTFTPMYESAELFQIQTLRARPRVEGTGRIVTAERFRKRLLLSWPDE